MNTFGTIFRLTSFGESHGSAIGGVIDGCPCGLDIDLKFIQDELDRRRPGQSALTTTRSEEDKIVFLSGIFEGKSTGAPIGFIIENKDSRDSDYDALKNVFRPSHADYTYQKKYGIRDYRGGGRASARETAVRVVGGAIAKLLLKKVSIEIFAFTSKIGSIALQGSYLDYDLNLAKESPVRCPDPKTAAKMEQLIANVRDEGDSIGGIVTCVMKGVPVGLGEPIFDRLEARLAAAMLSIPAAKGVEYGSGFDTSRRGSEINDSFVNEKVNCNIIENYNDNKGFIENNWIHTRTNFSGGIQGGISNGEDIYLNVAFKPTPTIRKEQATVDMLGNNVIISAVGREDPCVVPRAVSVVEAMAAMTIADAYLLMKTNKL